MKKLLLCMCVSLTSVASFSQDIKIKGNVVSIDGKECLKFSSSDANNVALLDIDGNEIVFLKYIHGSKYADLYNKIIFIDQKVSLTSKTYIYSKKLLVKRLLAEGLISDCKLNADKVETFVMKFDENVEGK